MKKRKAVTHCQTSIFQQWYVKTNENKEIKDSSA